jgi:HEAT repeat protein
MRRRPSTTKIASKMEPPVAREVLLELAEDSDARVRDAAHAGLIQNETPGQLIHRLWDSDHWREAGARLIEFEREAVPLLISALAEEWPVWKRAATILRVMRGIAEPALTEALHHQEGSVKLRLASILESQQGAEESESGKSE